MAGVWLESAFLKWRPLRLNLQRGVIKIGAHAVYDVTTPRSLAFESERIDLLAFINPDARREHWSF